MTEQHSSFSSLEKVFSGFLDNLSNFTPSKILENFLFQHISSFFYSNLICNFFRNLNETNALEYDLDLEKLSNIKKRFVNIENEASGYRSNFKDYKNINKEYYELFKENIKKEFPDFFPSLVEVEKLIGLIQFEKFLIFKKENLQKIPRLENDYENLLITKAIELAI